LYGFIGTSLSSPEMAGLLALKVELGKSRLGNANYYIYQLAATIGTSGKKYYHQGIPGYNGVVTTKAGVPGYNQITGVGTPYANNFLGVPSISQAGNPQTLSNP
jgi:kumamolisin